MQTPSGDAPGDDAVRDEAIAWLTRLQSGSSDRDHAEFERWYAASPRHADIYDSVLDSWEDTGLAARTQAGRSRASAGGRRGWPKVTLAAAAAILLIIAGGIAFTHGGGGGSSSQLALASGVGEIRATSLPDGSRVTLDTDSRMRIAFDGRERRVHLEQGRARFDIAHDAARPFIVAAGGNEVIARGTVFDVDLRAAAVIVALLRGAVEVQDGDQGGSGSRGSTMLSPGEQLTVARNGPTRNPVRLRDDAMRWPTGMLSFEDMPLEEVVAAANRYSATKLAFGDPGAKAHRFTGTFQASDTAGLARMVAAMFDLSASQRPDGSIVLTQRK